MTLGAVSAIAAESKSYVVNWFYMNNYYGGDEDCPQGLNPSSIDFYRREMVRLGYPKEQIDKILDGYPGAGDGRGAWVPIAVHRGNGKDDVYENPTTAPDPGLKVVEGRYAYGFDLGGRNDSPKSPPYSPPQFGPTGADAVHPLKAKEIQVFTAKGPCVDVACRGAKRAWGFVTRKSEQSARVCGQKPCQTLY